MKAVRLLAALGALILAGCGDGSIKSPDFESVTTLESIEVLPAEAGQPDTLPAGTTLSFVAVAHYTVTVPPGTKDSAGHAISEEQRTETITDKATWTSGNENTATVSAGVVTGKTASATPVTITASFQNKSAEVQVTVTEAILQGVSYIKPAGAARSDTDSYEALSGNTVPFEIYGTFSGETTPRRLDPATFTVNWTSTSPAVASNADVASSTFTANAIGAAVIRGQVQGVVAVPNFATATLNVVASSAFCEREFREPTAMTSSSASALCIGCNVRNPENVIDGDIATEAAMNIPLGLLLGSNVSLIVTEPGTTLAVGKPVGFIVSRDAQILSAELLSTLTIKTVMCDSAGSNCDDVESFRADNDALHLGLLGLIGSVPQYKLTSAPISQPANGVKLTFNGGLVGLLAKLNVQTACSAATTTP